MKTYLPDIITEEDRDRLLSLPRNMNLSFSDYTHEHSIRRVIRGVWSAVAPGDFSFLPPSYFRIEERAEGHPWHKDTGNEDHMLWCDWGCSLLLKDGTEEEVGRLHYMDGTVVHNYLGLAIHSSDEVHRVSRNKGRLVFLAFLQAEEL